MSFARMVALACLALAATTHIVRAEGSEELVIEGRVVCSGPEGVVAPTKEGCAPAHRLGLQTDQGKHYRFLENDSRAEIFQDERVRQKRLRIKGWLQGSDQIEIVKLQSVRDGRLYDLYYRCETCNITAYAGGPCPCCRDELEFHETPAP
jgi:hypothetical protein